MASILHDLCPPLVRRLYLERRSGSRWSGDYDSWNAAAAMCGGYNEEKILERVKDAALKVKRGEAAFERDSVVFKEPDYCWHLMKNLLAIASANKGVLRVLDFGGSLGSTFFQHKALFAGLAEVHWCVVEQEHFVQCGREYFTDVNLEFYMSVAECLSKHRIDVALFSGVLGYLRDPYEPLAEIRLAAIPHIIFDRTGFTRNDRDRITVQRVTAEIYPATYPFRFLSRRGLVKYLGSEYQLTDSFPTLDDSTRFADFLGMAFRRRD